MAGASWLILVAAALGALSVGTLVPVALDGVAGLRRRALIRGQVAGADTSSVVELIFADLCINGVVMARALVQLLLRLPKIERALQDIVRVAQLRYPAASVRSITECLLAAGVVVGLVVFLLAGQLLLALAGVVAPYFIVNMRCKQKMQARRISLREQLPDALRGLGMCFMAGLSLEQALDQTAQESAEPLGSELRRTVSEVRTGTLMAEALAHLDERLSIDEMRFVSVALEIQHRTGGSMREVLDAAAASLMASFELARSLEVQTAQARMSAKVVSIMPVLLVLVLSLVMDNYLASFFKSTAGFMLLVCAVGMEVTGILAIRRILGVDTE